MTLEMAVLGQMERAWTSGPDNVVHLQTLLAGSDPNGPCLTPVQFAWMSIRSCTRFVLMVGPDPVQSVTIIQRIDWMTQSYHATSHLYGQHCKAYRIHEPNAIEILTLHWTVRCMASDQDRQTCWPRASSSCRRWPCVWQQPMNGGAPTTIGITGER